MTDRANGSSAEDGERAPDELHGDRFAIIPEWLLTEKADVVKLYAILDRYAGRDRRIWPGQADLADRMECSRRHIERLIARLKEIGALTQVKRRYNGTTIWTLASHRSARPVGTDPTPQSGPIRLPVPPNESHEREPQNESHSLALDVPPTARPATRKVDQLFEAVAEVSGVDWRNGITPSARGAMNRAVADLRAVGATPAEVVERAANYRLWFDAALTPSALSRQWAQVASSPPPRRPRQAQREKPSDQVFRELGVRP